MDEFGVLVESIGFKSNGRSAPMADLKGRKNMKHSVSDNFGTKSGFTTKPSPMNRSQSSSLGDPDDFFGANKDRINQGFDAFDDAFGGFVKNANSSIGGGINSGSTIDFDFDSILKGSTNANTYDDDDIFGPMPGLKNSNSNSNSSSTPTNNGDVFGFMLSPPPPKQSASVDDLFGGFVGVGSKPNSSVRISVNAKKTAPPVDDLIPGFGGTKSKNRPNSETTRPPQPSGVSNKSTSTSAEDPFGVLGSSSSTSSSNSSGLFSEEDTGKNSVLNSIDELEDFAFVKVQKNTNRSSDRSSDFLFGDLANEKVEQRGVGNSANDLDSIFSSSVRNTSVPGHSAKTVDPVFDALFSNRRHETEKASSGTSSSRQSTHSVTKPSSGTSSSRQNTHSTMNATDDFTFMFGGAPSFGGKFEEREGESEERRKARLNHHLRTQARVEKAMADKNERDFQTMQEQEERDRLADTLDDDIKRWAAGREGNLRALLSSLQNVLWPDCGWQPVSLTDLITSVSVKKVYHRAALFVHPDKVQQKGATVRQKYIAEKVFDVLKEAWNKFNSEEL